MLERSPEQPENQTRRAPTVAVCGSGAEDPRLNAMAEAVGDMVARRGAARAGGLTVGILPTADPAAANPYVAVAIATGMGHARNVVIVQSADAVIAIGGEYGTLSEIALARKAGRPVVGLETWALGEGHTMPATSPEEAVELALRLAGR